MQNTIKVIKVFAQDCWSNPSDGRKLVNVPGANRDEGRGAVDENLTV